MTTPVAVTLERPGDYREWRAAARKLLANRIAPHQVAFVPACASGDLFGALSSPGLDDLETKNKGMGTSRGLRLKISKPDDDVKTNRIRVPRDFPELAKTVLCHRDDARFALLYRLLWRVIDEPRLLNNGSDNDVWHARRMARSVRRDMHKMKAFVRFRKIDDEYGEAFIAWFEPDHHIVERTAPFFTRRFTGMRWSIVTPAVSAHWDGHLLTFGNGASSHEVPDTDALEHHWRVYYASIFNPARLKVSAMRAEMPVKYWKNLPESRLIPELTRSAQKAQRAAPVGTAPSVAIARRLVANQPDMVAAPAERPATLTEVALGAKQCTRCSLCRHATSAVPGEGPSKARLMLVGEQPGDHEDLAGRPFIGPAGQVLNQALGDAGIDRKAAYLTNAVKHFKHTVRGKRRIHERPNAHEIEHCRWWLDAERDIIKPQVTLALGATAARAVLGKAVTIGPLRGQPITTNRGIVVVTAHPAYLLRLPNHAEAQLQRERFVADLRTARHIAGRTALPG